MPERAPLASPLVADLTRLARLASGPAGGPAGPVLVATDFDGVVAPLVDRPEDSRPTPLAHDALARLAAGDPARVRLALVSGRRLADLAALSGVGRGALLR